MVGAAIIALVESPEAMVQRALRLFRVAFVLMGVAMGIVWPMGQGLTPLSQGLMAGGCLAGLDVLRWGFALLAGKPAPSPSAMVAVLFCCAGVSSLGLEDKLPVAPDEDERKGILDLFRR